MKKLIYLAMILVCLAFVPASGPINSDCTCRGIKLYGRVKIVEAHEDFRVKVSEHPDLNIKITEIPTKCGEWRFVDAHEDFSIRYVEAHEDFDVKFSEHPGL